MRLLPSAVISTRRAPLQQLVRQAQACPELARSSSSLEHLMLGNDSGPRVAISDKDLDGINAIRHGLLVRGEWSAEQDSLMDASLSRWDERDEQPENILAELDGSRFLQNEDRLLRIPLKDRAIFDTLFSLKDELGTLMADRLLTSEVYQTYLAITDDLADLYSSPHVETAIDMGDRMMIFMRRIGYTAVPQVRVETFQSSTREVPQFLERDSSSFLWEHFWESLSSIYPGYERSMADRLGIPVVGDVQSVLRNVIIEHGISGVHRIATLLYLPRHSLDEAYLNATRAGSKSSRDRAIDTLRLGALVYLQGNPQEAESIQFEVERGHGPEVISIDRLDARTANALGVGLFYTFKEQGDDIWCNLIEEAMDEFRGYRLKWDGSLEGIKNMGAQGLQRIRPDLDFESGKELWLVALVKPAGLSSVQLLTPDEYARLKSKKSYHAVPMIMNDDGNVIYKTTRQEICSPLVPSLEEGGHARRTASLRFDDIREIEEFAAIGSEMDGSRSGFMSELLMAKFYKDPAHDEGFKFKIVLGRNYSDGHIPLGPRIVDASNAAAVAQITDREIAIDFEVINGQIIITGIHHVEDKDRIARAFEDGGLARRTYQLKLQSMTSLDDIRHLGEETLWPDFFVGLAKEITTGPMQEVYYLRVPASGVSKEGKIQDKKLFLSQSPSADGDDYTDIPIYINREHRPVGKTHGNGARKVAYAFMEAGLIPRSFIYRLSQARSIIDIYGLLENREGMWGSFVAGLIHETLEGKAPRPRNEITIVFGRTPQSREIIGDTIIVVDEEDIPGNRQGNIYQRVTLKFRGLYWQARPYRATLRKTEEELARLFAQALVLDQKYLPARDYYVAALETEGAGDVDLGALTLTVLDSRNGKARCESAFLQLLDLGALTDETLMKIIADRSHDKYLRLDAMEELGKKRLAVKAIPLFSRLSSDPQTQRHVRSKAIFMLGAIGKNTDLRALKVLERLLSEYGGRNFDYYGKYIVYKIAGSSFAEASEVLIDALFYHRSWEIRAEVARLIIKRIRLEKQDADDAREIRRAMLSEANDNVRIAMESALEELEDEV
jgi:hypothetical protein